MSFALAMLLLIGCQQDEPWAAAYEIESLDQTVGGPKAMAREGDFILENDRIRLAILGTRASMGPGTSGGSILDADLQRNDPRYTQGHGNDRMAEMFPTVNLNVTNTHEEGGEVKVLNDGSDGKAAVVCIAGGYMPFIELLDGLWTILGKPTYHMRTDYILAPGDGGVLIRSYATWGRDGGCDADLSDSVAAETSEDQLPLLDVALEGTDDYPAGAAFGDFYLQGGHVDVFAPDIGFDEEDYVFGLTEAGVNTFLDPVPVDFLGGTSDGTSYVLMPVSGRLFVPMFTSSQTVAVGAAQPGNGSNTRFDDGTALHYDRYLTIGRGDVGSALDAAMELTGTKVGSISGHVVEATTGTPVSGINVHVFRPGAEAPWSQFQTDMLGDTKADGSFVGTLPVGDWELQVHAEGRPKGVRVPIKISGGDEALQVVLEAPRPGSVSFQVQDEQGTIVPAKVSFWRTDGSNPRETVLGDGFIAGNIARVAFAPYGTGEVVLAPGEYQAVASRGIEYEIDITEPFWVGPETHVDLDLQVLRSVDSSGWISADFHVHAERSHDSGVSLSDRIGTMSAEGVEFLASTDHDAITDYAPVIEQMGMENWISSAVGLEVTTIEVGHFLGFPLAMDHLADQGGALDWNGLRPQEIIDGIRDLGAPETTEPVVFVGHPRDGILGYFDQYGVNPYLDDGGELMRTDSLLASFNDLLDRAYFTADFDAMEVLNGKRFELVRTPTQGELDALAADPTSVTAYDLIVRTMDEQQALLDGDETMGFGWEGTVDDWFTMLNLGYQVTALGNSDTHGKTSTESGCPRNFVQVGFDAPGPADPDTVATAVREGRVVASYGPFVRFYAQGEEADGPGSTVNASGDVALTIEVQSPYWFDVDRVELYENGMLIHEWTIETPNTSTYNLETVATVTPEKDSWYVVVAMGEDDLGPVFTPVEIPSVQLQDIVFDALAPIQALQSFGIIEEPVPVPRTFPVHPYALTNPIRVVADGDGSWDAPGLPDWLEEPIEPAEE